MSHSNSQEVYQLYDKVFKKILTLSSTAVINLINGLFETDHPLDSVITYNWTEHVGDDMRTCLADTIITINHDNHSHSYHIEAQMSLDENIVLRVFDYGFGHARKQSVNQHSENLMHQTLYFPEPKVILLYSKSPAPDEYILNLDFGSQGTFPYKVTTFKYLDSSSEQLTKKKMIILIPFELLKLRKVIEKTRTPENLCALQHLINHDILEAIQLNLDAGNITIDDAIKLRRLAHKLYKHIYSHYEEMKELNEMTDESLLLDVEIMQKEHEKAMAKLEAEKDALKAEKDALEAELEKLKKKVRSL
ncbi:MAG: DUF5320 domain-containing protein [Lachnospiraceae bacterium]|nr:DUF5320 domain-containing protein [Lachnospiraceae bacterium]